MIDWHSQNSSGKADPEESAILLRFQNIVDLSKYIIDTYDRLGSSVQYEIQQLLFETSGIPEEEKRRVVSSHKSQYQLVNMQSDMLDNQNK